MLSLVLVLLVVLLSLLLLSLLSLVLLLVLLIEAGGSRIRDQHYELLRREPVRTDRRVALSPGGFGSCAHRLPYGGFKFERLAEYCQEIMLFDISNSMFHAYTGKSWLVIGFCEPENLDEVSNRIPTASQRYTTSKREGYNNYNNNNTCVYTYTYIYIYI